jgi:hypothetical protein
MFEDISIEELHLDDAESLSNREILACIANADEESDFDIGAGWATLYERVPDPRFLFLSLSETYASVDPTMLVGVLTHLGQTSPDLKGLVADLALMTLQVKAKTLAGPAKAALGGLANAMSGDPEGAFDRLTDYAQSVLEETENQTADGGVLSAPDGALAPGEEAPTLRRYSPKEKFEVGDRLDHPKFGEGEVKSKAGKYIQVDFDGETRKLVCLP